MVLNWEKDKGYTLPARLPGTLMPESINEKLLGYHPWSSYVYFSQGLPETMTELLYYAFQIFQGEFLTW